MRFKLKLLPFFFLFGFTLSYGQYQQLLHKPYKDKVKGIDSLYRNTINKGTEDSLYIKNYTRQMEKFALDNQDKELALEANLLNAYAYWFVYGHKNPNLIYDLIDVAQKGEKEQVAHIEERATQAAAAHYWRKKEYERSFELLLRSAKILERMNPESFPNMAAHLNFIGHCYYYFKDYESAVAYYKKSSNLNMTTFNVKSVIEAQNTLGLCYQKMGEISHSNQLFLKIIQDTSQFKNETWKGIASGNLGYNYYLQKNYEKAIPLLKKDIQNARRIKEHGLIAGSAIPLVDIYVEQNKLDDAKQKIEEAKGSIQESGQTDRLRKLYPVMSKWYAANQQIDSSAIYLDSTVKAIETYHQKYSALKLLRANQKVEAKDRKLEIEKLNSETKLKVSQRNYIILFIALLLMGSLLAYWFRNKYLLRKQEIKELRIENTEKALAQAKNQLQNLKTKIQSEQEIIESLQQELQTNGNQKLINELKSKIIITNEDWNKYQRLFEEAYPTYLSSLKKTYTKITPSELRCLCLEKLQLSNKEMALVLGISTNSIVVTKHRIRKKLRLNSQQELQNLVRKIE